jgi:hypothetical protein
MKKTLAVFLPLLFATASWAGDDAVVSWKRIVGVITAPGTSNPVGGLASGGPWTASAGRVIVDLSKGDAAFFVEGLVLVGGNNSGTPGPVTSVKGTLVCDAGASDQAVIDTPAVPLDAEGNAEFHGAFTTAPPDPCTNPVFLIRVSPANVWIATAAVRYTRP